MTAEATHHLREHNCAHPGLRPQGAVLISVSANIQGSHSLLGAHPQGFDQLCCTPADITQGIPPPTSKWRNSLLSVLTSCLAESRAAMAVGFLYSYPRCHNKTERQNIPGHVHCGDRNRELNFPVFLRDYYYFLD